MKISLIAALDDHFGIGKNNQLLCHLPADLRHFKDLTLGKPVIMGRKTFLSIGKPLPGRQNIVLSTQAQCIPGVEVVSSFAEALAVAKEVPEIMIIGGEAVFLSALPLATDLYLTFIHHSFDADVFFPSFDKNAWKCIERTFRNRDEKNEFDLSFCHYARVESLK